jgi:transposase
MEATRVSVIEQSLTGIISVSQAAAQLSLSRRQVLRLRRTFLQRGAEGLQHGNRGRRPFNVTRPALKRRVLAIFSEWRRKCDGAVNAAHLRDILERDHGILLSRQTLWRWLRERGAVAEPRRKRRHRLRREREAREGAMLFLDGSPHRWFGPKKRKSTLILCSDDATGKALYGLFVDAEDRNSCFHVTLEVFRQHGLPQAFYLDRATQFVTTRPKKDGEAILEPTHWQQALRALGIRCIFATSPQARGRGERLNGSFQRRLTFELSYRRIESLVEASRFLNEVFIPEYNQRFSVKPAASPGAWRQAPKIDLRTVLCAKWKRHVSHDNTILHHNGRYQLLQDSRGFCFAGKSVEAQEWFDGSVRFFHPRTGLVSARLVEQRNRSKNHGARIGATVW